MTTRGPWKSITLAIITLGVGACGGAPAAKEGPKDPGAPKKEATDTPPPTSAPVKKSPCADGTCAECGEGICPSGYFCVDTRGHKGCAWIAGCVDKPGCACIAKELKACSCKDEGGVAKVACGG